jgi:hypothetical protein
LANHAQENQPITTTFFRIFQIQDKNMKPTLRFRQVWAERATPRQAGTGVTAMLVLQQFWEREVMDDLTLRSGWKYVPIEDNTQYLDID